MEVTVNEGGRPKSEALVLLSSERPRNVGWLKAGGLLFGDWGTSRLYVLGLAFFFAGRTSFYLICGMSLLILAVGWAYTQICRIYPDGGGVYTAAKQHNRILGVVGALLLFADYTVTASLSVLDAFHYFGLNSTEHFLQIGSPALWAIIAISAIGVFNLFGPKHTGAFALLAAVGMILITLVIVVGALPQVDWMQLPQKIGPLHWSAPAPADMSHGRELPQNLWTQFAFIMLALSGVEAIANLTGVMKRPVGQTARKSIWAVAFEVAIFNALLAMCMVMALKNGASGQAEHRDDMLAFLAGSYLGVWAEWGVRILGGVLLLSAGNTAITDMISVQYLMSRDGELPGVLQKLNSFGVPWIPALVAAAVPSIVLVIRPDVEKLSHLYAIGVVGAIAINVTLCAMHPRLRKMKRKIPMIALGIFLLVVWVTLAYFKREALLFVCIVLVVGLMARLGAKLARMRRPKLSLLRQAIIDQLPPAAMAKTKILLATAGSTQLAHCALELASKENCALVVAFIRDVTLSYKAEGDTRLTFDTDPAAQGLFTDFLELGHRYNVPILPMYDTGPNAPEMLAEMSAMMGVGKVMIGSSRRGALHQLIKGSFQRKLEGLLPPDVRVHVVSLSEAVAAAEEAVIATRRNPG